jgi:hypothetical protein
MSCSLWSFSLVYHFMLYNLCDLQGMCDDLSGDWSRNSAHKSKLAELVHCHLKTRTAIYWQSSTLFTLDVEFEGVSD